jgi:hypothetical protein
MFRPMDISGLLDFAPVPVRPQRNGWTPERQKRFVLALAKGAATTDAAHAAGMSRQGAYRLRAHPGSEGFADAWDRAVDFAGQVRAAARLRAVFPFGPDAMLVPRLHGNRVISYVQRDGAHALIAALRQLDAYPDSGAEK